MTAEYPNLQLLAYIFTTSLLRIDDRDHREVDAYVFPQWWPNTGGGFAEPGYAYGDAFTKEYTTVMFDNYHHALVAFGIRPAYLITNPNKAFMDDFCAKNMKSKYESEKSYKDEKENPL